MTCLRDARDAARCRIYWIVEAASCRFRSAAAYVSVCLTALRPGTKRQGSIFRGPAARPDFSEWPASETFVMRQDAASTKSKRHLAAFAVRVRAYQNAS